MFKEEIRKKVIDIISDNAEYNKKGVYTDDDKNLMEYYDIEETDYIIIFADIDVCFDINTDDFMINKNGDTIDHTINEIVEFIDKNIKHD